METNKKDSYEAPITNVIEVKTEGSILYASAPQYAGPYEF